MGEAVWKKWTPRFRHDATGFTPDKLLRIRLTQIEIIERFEQNSHTPVVAMNLADGSGGTTGMLMYACELSEKQPVTFVVQDSTAKKVWEKRIPLNPRMRIQTVDELASECQKIVGTVFVDQLLGRMVHRFARMIDPATGVRIRGVWNSPMTQQSATESIVVYGKNSWENVDMLMRCHSKAVY